MKEIKAVHKLFINKPWSTRDRKQLERKHMLAHKKRVVLFKRDYEMYKKTYWGKTNSSPYDEPTQPCPYCGSTCEADFVDVGVGVQQVGPYNCDMCGASQIGPYDKERVLTKLEKITGWYEPHQLPGSSANTFRGKIVNHTTAKALYNIGMLDKK